MRSFIKSVGGKRPALSFISQGVMARLGAYGTLRRVDWGQAGRLVFVCSGNICRSPYAAERARLAGFAVASLGVDASGNAPADPVAKSTGLRRGVDLERHVSVALGDFRPQDRDVYVGMEPHHLTRLGHLLRHSRSQATLLGLWCDQPLPYLPDPFGKKPECFEFVFSLIDQALDNIGRRHQVAA